MSRKPRPPAPPAELGRRERQILEAVYRLGRASVAEVREEISDPPSYSAVRGMLNLLKDKGHLRTEPDGLRYVYVPVVEPADASRSALAHVVRTFFAGSTANAASALFERSDGKLSQKELSELARLVSQAIKEGR
jgi:predicted transcriptional regulator